MASRHNWQIGREVDYPYEGPVGPGRRQVAWVFDLNRCTGCEACSVACKSAWTSGPGQEAIRYDNVERRPGPGYPAGWDEKLLALREPARFRLNVLETPTIFEDHAAREPPTGHRPAASDYLPGPAGAEDGIAAAIGAAAPWMFDLARICNHCELPACVAACPRKAVYKREEDGLVLIDQDRCRGYQECVKACPYKKSFFNVITRASEKCTGCLPRTEQGLSALCVEACSQGVRLQGFLTVDGPPREDNPIDYLVKLRKLALPLYPQFGTGPNVYYVPPLKVPDPFLEQLLGPGVEPAKELYRTAKEDPRLLGALLLFGASEKIVERFELAGGSVIGRDRTGAEVARVPLQPGMSSAAHGGSR